METFQKPLTQEEEAEYIRLLRDGSPEEAGQAQKIPPSESHVLDTASAVTYLQDKNCQHHYEANCSPANQWLTL